MSLSEQLVRLKIAYPTPSNEPRNEILVKFDYASEKRAFYVKWPIRYEEIVKFVNDKFGPNLTITWLQGSRTYSLYSQDEIDSLITRIGPDELTSAPSIILTPRVPDGLELVQNKVVHSPRRSLPILSSQSQFLQPIYVSTPGEVHRSYTDGAAKFSGMGFSKSPSASKLHGEFIPDTGLGGFTPNLEGDGGGRFVPEGILPPDRDSGGSFGSDSTTASSGLSEQESDFHTHLNTVTTHNTISVTVSDEDSFTAINSKEKRKEVVTHVTNTNSLVGVPNQWTKGKFLGSGGFGIVYTAIDNQTMREVAVKQIPISEEASNKEEINSFEREIQALQTLCSPRIITYLGIEKTDNCVSIFMEYMSGGSLSAYIRRMGALPEKKTLKFTGQILEGIHYLHSKSIVHRDIKGANVLLTKNGDIKLGDFGASKRLGTLLSGPGKYTNIKSVHGTSYWMAPEIIKGDGYGRRADIWSLGCTIVEMLTTVPPWYKLEPMAAMFKIASEKTEPVLPKEISQDCKKFVYQCLTHDKIARPYANELLYHPFVAKEINQKQQVLIH